MSCKSRGQLAYENPDPRVGVLIAAAPAIAADKRLDDAVAKAESQIEKGKPDEAVKTMQKVVSQVTRPEA